MSEDRGRAATTKDASNPGKEIINFSINGQPVQAREGWTILDTAGEYGIRIPTLCYHEAVKPSGACRLCVVEVREGTWSRVVVSCMYTPRDGMEVLTDSDRPRNVRRWVLEMLLAECPASKEIRQLAEEYGVTGTRFAVRNPDNQCMLCGLCVRVCREVVGVEALGYGSRGTNRHIATPYMEPSAACVACGSCLTVCPTGAMQSMYKQVAGTEAVHRGHLYRL